MNLRILARNTGISQLIVCVYTSMCLDKLPALQNGSCLLKGGLVSVALQYCSVTPMTTTFLYKQITRNCTQNGTLQEFHVGLVFSPMQ